MIQLKMQGSSVSLSPIASPVYTRCFRRKCRGKLMVWFYFSLPVAETFWIINLCLLCCVFGLPSQRDCGLFLPEPAAESKRWAGFNRQGRDGRRGWEKESEISPKNNKESWGPKVGWVKQILDGQVGKRSSESWTSLGFRGQRPHYCWRFRVLGCKLEIRMCAFR